MKSTIQYESIDTCKTINRYSKRIDKYYEKYGKHGSIQFNGYMINNE